MKSGHLATCVLVAVLALTSCSKRPAQDADTKIASVQSIIIDAYRTISLVETEFGADVDSLVSSNKTLPWDAQVSLAQRLEILCQIRGCDLPGWKDVDPWGSRLNFQQNNHVDERRAAPGDIDTVTKRLRIWSSGPNRVDENGAGDDILAPAYWLHYNVR